MPLCEFCERMDARAGIATHCAGCGGMRHTCSGCYAVLASQRHRFCCYCQAYGDPGPE